MKLIIASCLLTAVLAELPRFRAARFRSQRQELAPTTESSAEPTTDNAPYAASGWKPAQPFNLPNQPQDSYGAPYPPSGWKPDQPFTLPQQPPATSYGVPDDSYGVPSTDSSTEAEPTTTDNPQAERLVDVQRSEGSYYVLLPNGDLQKVQFVTETDAKNMAYTARLRLRDRAPVYLFRN